MFLAKLVYNNFTCFITEKKEIDIYFFIVCIFLYCDSIITWYKNNSLCCALLFINRHIANLSISVRW